MRKSARMPLGVRVYLSGRVYLASFIAGLTISGKNSLTSFAGRGGENIMINERLLKTA
jgi:hypothetical protein